jgi:starch phosphorylase
VEIVDSTLPDEVLAGQEISVQARVQTGRLTADDLAVELYLGRLNADGEIVDAVSVPMEPVQSAGIWHLYKAEITPRTGSGMHGFTARVLCRNRDLSSTFVPGIITWSS